MRRPLRMEGWQEAVRDAFLGHLEPSDLVGLAAQSVVDLLSYDENPNLTKPVIVVFTGYGLALAEHAREVSRKLSKARRRPMAPIYVFGPDNLSAYAKAEQTWDAVTYRTHILKDKKTPQPEVVADASKDTQHTSGQATVAAQRIEEEGFKTAFLVTAAYHQPRAYMTLLKALIKRGIHKRVVLVPEPYCLSSAWSDDEDPKLKNKTSWDVAFRDEVPKITQYQKKGDVARWEELKECLNRLMGA